LDIIFGHHILSPYLKHRLPSEAWTSVSFNCRVLAGRGLRDGQIPRPEESYRVWCDCDPEILMS
jgi:hypothetical protein